MEKKRKLYSDYEDNFNHQSPIKKRQLCFFEDTDPYCYDKSLETKILYNDHQRIFNETGNAIPKKVMESESIKTSYVKSDQLAAAEASILDYECIERNNIPNGNSEHNYDYAFLMLNDQNHNTVAKNTNIQNTFDTLHNDHHIVANNTNNQNDFDILFNNQPSNIFTKNTDIQDNFNNQPYGNVLQKTDNQLPILSGYEIFQRNYANQNKPTKKTKFNSNDFLQVNPRAKRVQKPKKSKKLTIGRPTLSSINGPLDNDHYLARNPNFQQSLNKKLSSETAVRTIKRPVQVDHRKVEETQVLVRRWQNRAQ